MAAVMTLSVLSASAQSELKGRVTDKKGNPIAGAKVENAKTAEQTTTDMNGQFTLQTAQPVKRVNVEYMGLRPVHKKKARQDMTVRMSTNLDKGHFFIAFQNSYTTHYDAAFGLMAGYMKEWGGYVSFVTGDGDEDYNTIAAGVMHRLCGRLFAYGGLGVNNTKKVEEYEEYDPYYDHTYTRKKVYNRHKLVIDFGVLYRWKRINVNIGGQCGTFNLWGDSYPGIKPWALNVGFGFNF